MSRSLDLKDAEALKRLKANVNRKLIETRLSPRQASIRACGSASWLSSWLPEHQNKFPNAVWIRHLADVLNCSVESLWGGGGTVAPHNGRDSDLLQTAQKLLDKADTGLQQVIDLLNHSAANSILSSYFETGGLIDARFDPWLPYLDILEPAKTGILPGVIHMGRRGLAAMALEDDDPGALVKFMQDLPRAETSEINDSLNTAIRTERGTVALQKRRISKTALRPDKTVLFVRMHLPAEYKGPDGKIRKAILNLGHQLPRLYDTDTPHLPDE